VRRLGPAVVIALAVVAGASGATRSVAVVKAVYNNKLQTKILVNGAGLTLYLNTSDFENVSVCRDDPLTHCRRAWPPLLTTGRPKAGSGVKASALKTAKRSDGGTQVMYAGHLLYTWAGSPGEPPRDKPGSVNGQGLRETWWAVSPAGKPIKRKPTPAR
jgi:predicted lipoprotein with Yx(FWY)xxD motif